ncbi:MAG TPA: hypothetical protein VGC93_01305 [Thermoanaerobaculia bacterium]
MTVAALVLVGGAGSARAGALKLVKDIATGKTFVPSGAFPLGAVGSRVLFSGSSSTETQAFWGTDGTSYGTELLGHACPGGCQATGEVLGIGGGVAYLRVSIVGAVQPDQLWRTNGTAVGTVRLRDAAGRGLSPRHGTALGRRLFFFGCAEDASCGLWVTDGTPAGSRLQMPLAELPWLRPPMAVWGGKLYFALGSQLWATTPNAATPSLVFAAAGGEIRFLTPATQRLFFVAASIAGDELWSSSGTAAGTQAVTTFSAPSPFQSGLETDGSRVYFIANDLPHGQELWSSDGMKSGTRRETNFTFHQPFGLFPSLESFELAGDRPVFVATDGLTGRRLWTLQRQAPEGVAPLTDACGPECGVGLLERLGSRVVFVADDLSKGTEPFATDGTKSGTRLLRDICPGGCSANIESLAAVAGKVVFWADHPTAGAGLWESDGTPEGTRLVFQRAGSPGSRHVIAAGGRYFFEFTDPDYGSELWMTDGTAQGTSLVADLSVDEVGSSPRGLAVVGQRSVFLATVDFGAELWSTAGSEATTERLLSGGIDEPCPPHDPCPVFTTVGDRAYFTRRDEQFRPQLWRTDGTPAGTMQLTAEPEGLYPGDIVDFVGGTAAFVAGGPTGPRLWRTNGEASGTVPILNLPPGARLLGSVPPYLYLVIADGAGGVDVWRSDGTQGGTIQLTSYAQGSHRFLNHPSRRVGGELFFMLLAGNQQELWRTDGTPAGTAYVASPNFYASPVAFGGLLYFFAAGSPTTRTLFRTNGSGPGITAVRSFEPELGVLDCPREQPTVFAGRLYFLASTRDEGCELWSTAGTPETTVLVRDIRPGPDGSAANHLTAAPDALYFTADDGVHGLEVWRSDGTAGGTRLVEELAPMQQSSLPANYAVLGDRLLLSAHDGLIGQELWSLPLGGARHCVADEWTLCLGDGRFAATARWRDFAGNRGDGHAVALTADTGYFWFFAPSNVETILKVLDGRAVNGHHWVFYGALSSVEYTLTVTDLETGGTRRYFNPLGRFGSVGDTSGFGSLGAHARAPASAEPSAAITAPCEPTARRLCLGGRFAVEASWKDFQERTGLGTAVLLTADTGYFWFFDPANVEVVIKVLDGTPLNGKHWVFYGALSNVEYTLTVTDTATGKVKTYRNPLGKFGSQGDTSAF